MGNKSSKCPKINIIWFDQNNSRTYNKKVIKKINKIFSILKDKYKNLNLDIILETYSTKEQIQVHKINDFSHEDSFYLIITSGRLKYDVINLFSTNKKVNAIIIFCFKKKDHEDALKECSKVIKIVDKADDLIIVIKEHIELQIDSKIKDLSRPPEIELEIIRRKSETSRIRSNTHIKNNINNEIKYLFFEKLHEGMEYLLEIRKCFFDEKKGMKINFCSPVSIKDLNNSELQLIHIIYDLISLMKLDCLPFENFDVYKTRVLEIFLLSNIFVEGFNHNKVKELKLSPNLLIFKQEILSLFMTNNWILTLNKILININSNNLIELSKLKYIISCLVLNFCNINEEEFKDEYVLIVNKGYNTLEFNNKYIITSPNFLVFEKVSDIHYCTNSIILKIRFENDDTSLGNQLNYLIYKKNYLLILPFVQFKILSVTENLSITTIQVKLLESNFMFNIPFNCVYNEINNNSCSIDPYNCFIEQTERFLCEKIELFLHIFEINNKEESINFSLNLSYLHETLGILSKIRKIYWQSLDNYTTALQIAENSLGYEHVITTNINFQIGKVHMLLVEKEEALNKFEICLKVFKNLYGDECLILAITNFNIAKIYRNLMDNNNALKYYVICQNLFEKVLGENSILNLKALNEMAITHFQLNSLSKSLEVYEKILSIMKVMKLDEIKSFYPVVYSNIGSVYEYKKDLQNALDFYGRSLQYESNSKHFNLNKRCFILTTISNIYDYQKKFQKAIKCIDDCLSIKIKLNGDQHLEVAFTYNNLSYLYNKLGDFKKAYSYARKAEEISSINFTENTLFTSKINNNIGMIAFYLDDYATAIDYITKSIDTKINILGESNIEIINMYYQLSVVYDRARNYDSAVKMLKKAISTEKRIKEINTKGDPNIINSCNNKTIEMDKEISNFS